MRCAIHSGRFFMGMCFLISCMVFATGIVPEANAATALQIPGNRFMRPVGWPEGSTIEFRAGTVLVDSSEGGVQSGRLANETWLSPWNSTMRIAFAAGSLIQFERTGGVLTGSLARDSTLRIAQSSLYVSFRGVPATVTFGYDGGVASGVLSQTLYTGGRTYAADTQVSFTNGVVSGSAAWVPPVPVGPVPAPGPESPGSASGFLGVWSGTFRNTLGGSGRSVLTLRENDGQIQGDWDGSTVYDVRISGNTLTFAISDNPNNRVYAVVLWLSDSGKARLRYDVSGSRTYSGVIDELTRLPSSGTSLSGSQSLDPYSGYWTGTYRNSLGSSGPISLTLVMQGDIVTGDWDGSAILDGKRVGDKLVWRCYDSQNRNTYALEFHVSPDGVGVLRYSVTGSRSYTGSVENYRKQ